MGIFAARNASALLQQLGTDWLPQSSELITATAATNIPTVYIDHVTPFGCWVRVQTEDLGEFGDYFDVGVRTTAGGTTFADYTQIDGIPDTEERQYQRSTSDPMWAPMVFIDLTPNTTYYLRVRRAGSTDPNWLSGEATFTTSADPRPSLVNSPTVTAAELARVVADSDAAALLPSARGEIDVGEPTDQLYETATQAPLAQLIYEVSGLSSDETIADRQFGYAKNLYANYTLTGNPYRWAETCLADAAWLRWASLSDTEKNTIGADLMDSAEAEIAAFPRRAQDTDQWSANATHHMVNGFTAANCPDSAVAARGEAILLEGLKIFYGFWLPTLRRDHGQFAKSGGQEHDSSDYSRGTEVHWLHALHALINMGATGLSQYKAVVWNSLRSHQLYARTPTKQGALTWNDVEGDPSTFTQPYFEELSGAGADIKSILLRRLGETAQAGYAKQAASESYTTPTFWKILSANNSLASQSISGLPTAFGSKAHGYVVDRTDWSATASMVAIRAGDKHYDHAQKDSGDWCFIVNGQAQVVEYPDYVGGGGSGLYHSIPILPISPGTNQYTLTDQYATPEITQMESTAERLTVTVDLTGAYRSNRQGDSNFTSVTRKFVWLKGVDAVCIQDTVSGVAGNRISAIQTFHSVTVDSSTRASFGTVRLDVLGGTITTTAADGSTTRINCNYTGDSVITVVQAGTETVSAIAGGVQVGTEQVVF